jgi:ribose transport system ATP-binding protein
VEIARALATGCRVLVLDEPTSSLGREDVERLFALIARFKEQGRAVVYISHFLDEVTRIADRVVVLRDGRIAGSGATVELSANEIVRLMVGRPIDDLFPRSVRQAGEPVLQVDPLVPGSHALTLHRGEIVGIAGLVGAGRTRLLRTIFGLEPGRRSPRDRWRQGIGMLSEDRKGEGLAVTLTVADNVTMSRLEGLGVGPFLSPSRQSAAVARWIERLGIRTRGPWQPVEELSGGNQQKVAFARLLHHGVEIMILDEPTRGIDVSSKAEIYALIDQWVSEKKSVLMVSSYLPELLGVCDRIAVMRRGRLGPARPVQEWDEDSLVMAATGAGE